MRPLALASILLLSGWLCITQAQAGDGNPFGLRRLTVDLTPPFKGNPKYPYKDARLLVEFTPRSKDYLDFRLNEVRLQSLMVELGKTRLTVPAEILRDIESFGLSTLEICWFGGQYQLLFGPIAVGDMRGDARLSWRETDGKLVNFQIERKSLNSRYPNLLPLNPEK